MPEIMSILDYVQEHCERGECVCGKCVDGPKNPENFQPRGHTEDMMFFKVKARGDPNKETFLELVKEKYPYWLDGKEHSYIEMGADVGDQATALRTMGLGSLLKAWTLITPNFLPIPKELKMEMAGAGMITIQRRKNGG